MEGFVLPPSESFSILKEKDMICVKKKRGPSDIAGLADGRKCLELGAAEEQPVNGGMRLLANDEFEKETGGYRSESEEGEPEKLEDIEDTPKKTVFSKKRKAVKKPNSERKKRRKSGTREEGSGTPEDVQNTIQPEHNGSSHQHTLLLKSPIENGKPSNKSNEPADSSNSDVEERKKNVPSNNRSDQIQENGRSNGVSTPSPQGSKKFPSRSTRRRKLKRQWLREQKLREKEMQLSITGNQQLSEKGNGKSVKENQQPGECKSVKEHRQPDECNDEEGDIVPVIVRPGHIRFGPFSEEDIGQTIQQHKSPVETFQWNGITNKKKGQKWGTDWKNLNQESSDIPVVDEATSVNVPIEFDKLKPCTTLPQEGDTVAYRLIELSSSWTPELSSFRVGKVSKFDPNYNRITLVQVPEYPIAFEKDGNEVEESATKSNMSLYGDDGSLEIDYPSLIDVQIIKHGNLSAATSMSCLIGRATTGNQGLSSSYSPRPNSNKQPEAKKLNATAQENEKVNAWDEVCETLSAKKAELAQEDNWAKRTSTAQSSWSYRALRGSAMGPIMARLRAQNEL